MCLELIEYITLDAYVEGQPREIYIYYKLLDEPLKDKRSLFKGVFTLFTQHMKVCYYWQDDNAFCLQSYVSGVSGQSLRCCCKRFEVQ